MKLKDIKDELELALWNEDWERYNKIVQALVGRQVKKEQSQ